jgi:hypothetical protein
MNKRRRIEDSIVSYIPREVAPRLEATFFKQNCEVLAKLLLGKIMCRQFGHQARVFYFVQNYR